MGSETDAIVFLHFFWELSSFGEFFEASLLVTNATRTVLDARIAFLVVDAIAATTDDDGVQLKRVDGGKLVADFADEAFVLAGFTSLCDVDGVLVHNGLEPSVQGSFVDFDEIGETVELCA